MPEYKKVKTFVHTNGSIGRVASISYDPVVAQLVPIPDGSGDVTFLTIKSAPVQGVVVIRDKAQAEILADDPDSASTMSFQVETELDVTLKVSFTGVVTGAARGSNFALGGSGPWTVPFGAATVSEPVTP